MLSSDGLFACVSGYKAPAGPVIGATLIPGSATLPLYPSANVSRLVACYDSATGALVNTINLNNQSSFFTVTDIKTAFYYQNPTQGNLSGLILGGGSSAASGTSSFQSALSGWRTSMATMRLRGASLSVRNKNTGPLLSMKL